LNFIYDKLDLNNNYMKCCPIIYKSIEHKFLSEFNKDFWNFIREKLSFGTKQSKKAHEITSTFAECQKVGHSAKV